MVATLNDERRRALRRVAALGGLPLANGFSTNDMLLAFLKQRVTNANDPQSTINDGWLSWAKQEGFLARTVNEAKMALFADFGFTQPHLNERERLAWADIAEDEILDPGFNTPGDWTQETGWTVGSGVATCDGTQIGETDLIFTASASVDGRKYRAQYTVTAYTSGTVRVVVGGSAGISRSSTGTFQESLSAVNVSAHRLRGDANFVGTIDNFQVIKVG